MTHNDIPEPYKSAHQASLRSRDKLLASRWVGCFYCGLVYAPTTIKKWIDDDQTAMCPVCGIDSVLPLTVEQFASDFLEQMHHYWFELTTLPLDHLELFAMIGEDEYGSGDVGLKQAIAPAGVIPMVAIRREKVEQFWSQYEAQAKTYRKRIYLVKFQAVEVVRETEYGE
jgi:hypothetical protein